MIPNAGIHNRHESDIRRKLVNDDFPMLELILKGVDEPQHKFYYQNPRYNEDYYQCYDHSGLKLVFNAEQNE
jgi:hypothetical protein